jgi:hypothetical protein
MKGIWKAMAAALLLAFLATAAFGWEAKIKGDAEYRYRYWTRTGDIDIFGNMDNQVYLGINHLNTFPTGGDTNLGGTATSYGTPFGVVAGENCYGKEMSTLDYRVTLYPEIKVNPAIAIISSLNLTSLGIWSDGDPYMTAAPYGVNGQEFARVGYVNSLYTPIGNQSVGVSVPNTYLTMQYIKLAIKTPVVDFSLGYKADNWGMGLWKNPYDRSSCSFSVTAPYGPLSIGFAPYIARNQSNWKNGSQHDAANNVSRNTGRGSYQQQESRRNYFLALEVYLEYKSGDLACGIQSDSYVQQHANRVTPRLQAIGVAAPDGDVVRYRVDPYLKYNNGRFFFNAEAVWLNQWTGGRGTASGSLPTSLVNINQDHDAWLYALEGGFICGPSKLTMNYVRATGNDPTDRYDDQDAADGDSGVRAGYIKYWGLLMYDMYGTGSNWDAAGEGQPTDFDHLGARLDYAVASNLNVFGIYSYAWRDQPNGWTLGGDGRGAVRRFTNNDLLAAQNGGFTALTNSPVPIPDSAREIGWEVDAGFDWKLLENMVWSSTFAYWKPGSWWAYAYPNTAAIYRAHPGAAILTADYTNGRVGLDRDIAPLFAVQSDLTINF